MGGAASARAGGHAEHRSGRRARDHRQRHGRERQLGRQRRWCMAPVLPDASRGGRPSIWVNLDVRGQTGRMNSRVHPKYKTRYRVRNWPEYERGLVRRGDVTLWFSHEALAAWRSVEEDYPDQRAGCAMARLVCGQTLRALGKPDEATLLFASVERDYPDQPYLFVSERGGPLTTASVRKIIARAGDDADIGFPVHPHMLRHACGFYLANKGIDTRAIQGYMGHKNIQHTVRYTELAPNRFKDFWSD